MWLDEAKQISTLDRIKGQFSLIVTGEAGYWNTATSLIDNQLNLPLAVHYFDNALDSETWGQLTCTQPGDALLVRSDGFIALRLTANDTPKFLVDTIRSLLGL